MNSETISIICIFLALLLAIACWGIDTYKANFTSVEVEEEEPDWDTLDPAGLLQEAEEEDIEQEEEEDLTCPQCKSEMGVKFLREGGRYCEDCGWPDEDFDTLDDRPENLSTNNTK